MSIRVAHVNKEAGTYVGRPARGRRGSPLANPYKVDRDGDRGMVIAKYEVWLKNKLANGKPPDANPVLHEIERLAWLYRRDGSLVLTCWCAPLPCHADVIARVVLERLET